MEPVRAALPSFIVGAGGVAWLSLAGVNSSAAWANPTPTFACRRGVTNQDTPAPGSSTI
jgi:hypothetical protein